MCDACANPWEYKDDAGKWCSSCYADRNFNNYVMGQDETEDKVDMPTDTYGLWAVYYNQYDAIVAVVEGTFQDVSDKYEAMGYSWELLPEVEVIGDEPKSQTFREYWPTGGTFTWDDVNLAAWSEGVTSPHDLFPIGTILWCHKGVYAYDPQKVRPPGKHLIRVGGQIKWQSA